MRARIAVVVAAVAFGSLSAVPFVALANTAVKGPKLVTVTASRSGLSASGGSVTLRATVKNAKTCAWSSSPKVKGFDASVKCAAKLSRVAKVSANTSVSARRFTFSLATVNGKVKTSGKTVVTEQGKPVTTTNTTVPPTTPTTNTTVPPTTPTTNTTVPPTTPTTNTTVPPTTI